MEAETVEVNNDFIITLMGYVLMSLGGSHTLTFAEIEEFDVTNKSFLVDRDSINNTMTISLVDEDA